MLVAAWTILPGHPGAWTACLLTMAFPLYSLLMSLLPPRQTWRSLWNDAVGAVAQVGLQVCFLAQQAFAMTSVISGTLMRVALSRPGILEWETSAASNARDGLTRQSQTEAFFRAMMASPIIALFACIATAALRPQALPYAMPFCVLWFSAPWLAWRVSQPSAEVRPKLSLDDRHFLLEAARGAWSYFARFMNQQENSLPPDNMQEYPAEKVAHRTSPTNIAMGLLSTLAAHDLGFITLEELREKIEATLTTIEGMERHEGHLFNWYDTETLAPLLPRYVSTVDSGNLAASLVTLAEGLLELGLPSLAERSSRYADSMSFYVLVRRQEQLLAIGYRVADAEDLGGSMRRTTTCWRQRHASRASWRSQRATFRSPLVSSRATGDQRQRSPHPAVVERARCSST
jgi:cyclic beta-1,2-glucan synthetase